MPCRVAGCKVHRFGPLYRHAGPDPNQPAAGSALARATCMLSKLLEIIALQPSRIAAPNTLIGRSGQRSMTPAAPLER